MRLFAKVMSRKRIHKMKDCFEKIVKDHTMFETSDSLSAGSHTVDPAGERISGWERTGGEVLQRQGEVRR